MIFNFLYELRNFRMDLKLRDNSSVLNSIVESIYGKDMVKKIPYRYGASLRYSQIFHSDYLAKMKSELSKTH